MRGSFSGVGVVEKLTSVPLSRVLSIKSFFDLSLLMW